MNAYQKLFLAYVTEMRKNKGAAEAWWKALLKAERAMQGTKAAAEEEIERRWVCGPASHPFVLGTYRKYFLACDALNERIEDAEEKGEPVDFGDESLWGSDEEEAVQDDDELDAMLAGLDVDGPIEPWTLLIEMLEGRADDLSEFLEGMVFAPIGIDEDEHFI